MPQKPAKQARRRASGPDLRVSPLVAYGDGTPTESWREPSPFVAGCIAVAAILHSATRERSAAAREQLLDRATEQMAALLDPAEATRGCGMDAVAPRSHLLPFYAAVDRMQLREGAPRSLMCHMLESLAALVPADSVEGGRILSARIMYAYDDVHNELRTELSRSLVLLGFRLRNHELLSRGWAHMQGRAIVVGNLPQSERAARRGYKHALLDGDKRLISTALNMRGVVAGMRGNVATSIRFLWEGLQTADHPTTQMGILANLGETLYRSGRYREARAARAMVLLAGHGKFGYVSLGGYAVCCAALGDIDGVKWAAGQAMLVASSATPSRQLAQGLMGCADACGEVDLADLAKTLYDRGRAMADAHGYHDLQFRADPSVRRPRATPVPLDGSVKSTLDSIAELAPDGVPTDAVLAW
jgi:hypothetical protein